ncbi:MAG: hypothetical protein N0A24_05250 [Armatimonadetes bacterium]|nr:hypothetical protein [Armatimonadota bacterium]MDW8153617.1 hypothetical protein [Armatimonadota bacterium]
MFGELRIRLDPWDVDYGPELSAEEEPEGQKSDVFPDVELPEHAWQPVYPAEPFLLDRIYFVDGVRRIDARVVVEGEPIAYGAFGSFAAGSVCVQDGVAQFGPCILDRLLVIGGGRSLDHPIPVMPRAAYRPVSTEGRDSEAPLQKLQEEMRLAEERLARELADADRTLVVVDGPLTFADPVRGAAVGFIKHISRFYLSSPKSLEVLRGLPTGARTPLFGLHGARRFARYSWFLRLIPPAAGDPPFSGIVRLEVSETVGREAARRLADATAWALPRFVRPRGMDPRAPQNLAPIGALEAHLRRRLGDRLLLRRHIQTLIVREVRSRGDSDSAGSSIP